MQRCSYKPQLGEGPLPTNFSMSAVLEKMLFFKGASLLGHLATYNYLAKMS